MVAIEPAAPDAVTTDVNGTSARAVAEVDRGKRRFGSGEPVAVGDRTGGPVDCLVVGVAQPERGEEAIAQLLGDRGAADGLGQHAQDQVVRVRVVPRHPGLGVRLADVSQRPGRDPRYEPGLAEQRLVDPGMEIEVAQAAGVVEQLADRRRAIDREPREGRS